MPTSDGISDSDWDSILILAEKIANTTFDVVDDELLITSLMKQLNNLQEKYGELPSILATRADYIDDKVEELRLLKEAYDIASKINDNKNKSFISASIAEFYVERDFDINNARYWNEQLLLNLKLYSDSYLESVHDQIFGIINQANQGGRDVRDVDF